MMKLLVIAALVAVTFGAVKRQINVTPRTGQEIRILSYENDASPDGSYKWAFQSENGISAQETGQQDGTGEEAGTAAQGSYQFTSPEGVPVRVDYIADKNGFQPAGDVLPTPPPIPSAIQRSLDFNAANPSQDDQEAPKAFSRTSLPVAPSPKSYSPVGVYSLLG